MQVSESALIRLFKSQTADSWPSLRVDNHSERQPFRKTRYFPASADLFIKLLSAIYFFSNENAIPCNNANSTEIPIVLNVKRLTIDTVIYLNHSTCCDYHYVWRTNKSLFVYCLNCIGQRHRFSE